jgi:8-oxo-dGTP diphosphatase
MQGKWTGVGGKTQFLEEPLESCIREVKEETGLDIKPELRGVATTINIVDNSKWFLFVYIADQFTGEVKECNEGTLEWIDENELYKKNLIGFIEKMLPYVFDKKEGIFTGKFLHDDEGNVKSYVLRRGKETLESR